MELITRSQLSAKRSTFEKAHRPGALQEALNESTRRFSRSTEITIFLSHKHEEQEALKDAIAFLKSLHVQVYVDWMDEGMPKHTNGATATRLKEKIASSDKFILLATEKAIHSKWCNWELGLGDAHKFIKDIALLVVEEDNTKFSGSEYLEIYPIIGRRFSWSDEYFVVRYPDGLTVDLEDWLAK